MSLDKVGTTLYDVVTFILLVPIFSRARHICSVPTYAQRSFGVTLSIPQNVIFFRNPGCRSFFFGICVMHVLVSQFGLKRSSYYLAAVCFMLSCFVFYCVLFTPFFFVRPSPSERTNTQAAKPNRLTNKGKKKRIRRNQTKVIGRMARGRVGAKRETIIFRACEPVTRKPTAALTAFNVGSVEHIHPSQE